MAGFPLQRVPQYMYLYPKSTSIIEVICGMTSVEVAREIRTSLPKTEDIIVDYLSGYLVDDASEEEDVLQITRNMLESFAFDKPSALDELLVKLGKLLEARLNAKGKATGPRKLEKTLQMGKTSAMSNTLALAGGVDLESINKSK